MKKDLMNFHYTCVWYGNQFLFQHYAPGFQYVKIFVFIIKKWKFILKSEQIWRWSNGLIQQVLINPILKYLINLKKNYDLILIGVEIISIAGKSEFFGIRNGSIWNKQTSIHVDPSELLFQQRA